MAEARRRGGRKARRRWQRLNAPLVAATLAAALSLAVYAGHLGNVLTVPGLDSFEAATVDARFRLRGPRQPGSDIVLVALDDRTRREHPEVFQTRAGWAELVDAIAAAEPRAIAIDAFFSSPEVNLSAATVAAVRDALARVDAPAPGSPLAAAADALASVDSETRGDDRLAAAIADAGNVVLAHLFYLDGDPAARGAPEPPGLAAARIAEAVALDQPALRRPLAARAAVVPLPAIAAAAAGAGHVNVSVEDDGDVRKLPLVVDHGGRYYRSLSLVLAQLLLGDPPASYVAGATSLDLGDRRVPVDARGRITIDYLGPSGTFPRVSAADVLAGDAAALAGKIALVGYTDVARDKIAAPFDERFDGVELHATVADNLVSGDHLRGASPAAGLLAAAALAAFLTLLQLRRVRQRRAWVAGVGLVVAIGGYLVFVQLAFVRAGLVVDLVAPVATAVFVALASLSAALATEGREKAALRSAFSQYVHATLVDRLLADPSRVRLGGERRELTVLFSDIRGFSKLAERLEPEVLFDFLNAYLTPMTELVMQEHGMLDKYIGDAIMAVYGAPLELPEHATSACRAALAMRAALADLNRGWRAAGLPEIDIGIGLNSGSMSVGNMGSEQRFDYTVLGDAVNLGARLEGLTKAYRVGILCGARTAELAGDDLVFRELDTARVVGRDGVDRIFELCGERGVCALSDDDLALFSAGLAAYRARDWAGADQRFAAFLERHPDDGPAAVLLERVARLRAAPPADDWDGVFSQQSK